jgi:hypothetical protein
VYVSIEDRYCFDADTDQDPTFHFYVDPDPDPDPNQSLQNRLLFLQKEPRPIGESTVYGSVVDRHRFDADPDPDPTLHLNFDPDPNPNQSLQNRLLFFQKEPRPIVNATVYGSIVDRHRFDANSDLTFYFDAIRIRTRTPDLPLNFTHV